MKSIYHRLILISLVLTASGSSAVAQEKVDFVTQIKPIFEKHCMQCHNVDGDQYPIELKDDAFNYIVAGEPENSEMFDVLISDDPDYVMPPPDFERQISDDQIELIRLWIAEGADWPESVTFTMWTPEESSTTSDTTDSAGAGEVVAANAIDPRIFGAIGSLHPAILHLPMGLLLAAGFFAFLSLRGNFVMSDCAYYCLWLGALTGVVACVTGWFFSESKGMGTVVEFMDLFNQDHKVFWHRTSALVCTIFAVLLGMFAMSARASDPDEGITWKLGAMILAAGIGYVGMTGGKLVYPSNHYRDLNELLTEAIGGEIDTPTATDASPTDEADADSAPPESTEKTEEPADDETSELI